VVTVPDEFDTFNLAVLPAIISTEVGLTSSANTLVNASNALRNNKNRNIEIRTLISTLLIKREIYYQA
jgi:hypothetical protein